MGDRLCTCGDWELEMGDKQVENVDSKDSVEDPDIVELSKATIKIDLDAGKVYKDRRKREEIIKQLRLNFDENSPLLHSTTSRPNPSSVTRKCSDAPVAPPPTPFGAPPHTSGVLYRCGMDSLQEEVNKS